MGKQLKGLLYFFVTDIRFSLTIFWSILFGVLVLSLSISYFLLGVEDAVFYFGFPNATYFYCMFLGFLTVKEGIPFALKMGATRRNLFIATGLFFLGIAFVKAVVSSTLQSITVAFTEAAGISTFNFIHLAEFVSDTWLNRIMVDTAVMFLLLTIMFLFGLLFYNTGLLGGGSVAAILVVLLLLGIAKGSVFDFFARLLSDLDLMFFLQLFGIGIVLYALSYLFTRRITIINTK
ncbi:MULTISPECIES: hypothetical protein [Oceanobacillus]|uniref:hypothetical protein n=1 Tax=Oceanobacillus TaxID=182709 RepID=UPI00195A974F|nr:hypothetical protein [Oceanobacillus caeni]MBU8791802.1 hypothetical protein [Oceanobacillus caeni]